MIDAFILVQAAQPGTAAAVDLADALRAAGFEQVWPIGVAYDALVRTSALGPHDLAIRVTGIQDLPEVGRTLTLPVVATGDEEAPDA